LAVTISVSGCLGVDNMQEFKTLIGFADTIPVDAGEPLTLTIAPQPGAPIARALATPTLVRVGDIVLFSAEQSSDPSGRSVTFGWNFGDGQTANGVHASHSYATIGAFTARLTARNDAGIASQTTIVVTVVDNRAPTIDVDVFSGSTKVSHGFVGQSLSFVARATDPDGDSFKIEWSFGDGVTERGSHATHAYATGGRYRLDVRAIDSQGAAGWSRFSLPIDLRHQIEDAVVIPAAEKSYAIPVSAGPRAIAIVLSFDPLLGANDLNLRLQDADGGQIGRSATSTAPTAQGVVTETIALSERELQSRLAGDWNVVVERAVGVDVKFTLSVAVDY
ncbi:MAG TPA: PKD domain-containing protein, partial [Burkholderiales bacterium]|nr:PKD domain-containing protein [Burkholderiales bacterium]